MFAKKKGVSRRSAIFAVVEVLALCMVGAGVYVAFADEPPPLAATPAAAQVPVDLEQAFWACDYVSTTYGVQAAPIAFCSEVTAALQEQKFGDDFSQLLEWWRQNKPAQHARLRSTQIANASIR